MTDSFWIHRIVLLSHRHTAFTTTSSRQQCAAAPLIIAREHGDSDLRIGNRDISGQNNHSHVVFDETVDLNLTAGCRAPKGSGRRGKMDL